MSNTGLVSLNDLATQINTESDLIEKFAKKTIDHAFKLGELLVQAKSQVKHGEWQQWVKVNLAIGVYQCQRYMKLFNNRDLLTGKSGSGPAFNLKNTLKLLVEDSVEESGDAEDDTSLSDSKIVPEVITELSLDTYSDVPVVTASDKYQLQIENPPTSLPDKVIISTPDSSSNNQESESAKNLGIILRYLDQIDKQLNNIIESDVSKLWDILKTMQDGQVMLGGDDAIARLGIYSDSIGNNASRFKSLFDKMGILYTY